jgi:cellulose synthase/poly-beta-1,6-N-acetylglucosamine synthase-like glycosyltransferase
MILAIMELQLLLLGLALAVPTAVLLVQCVVAVLPWRTRPAAAAPRDPSLRAVVLVPAHDEADGIAATVAALACELGPRDEILVVADNCTDDTSTLARAAGARVVERCDPEHRGKGYALRFAVDALAADPPDVVVIVDADCRVRPGSLHVLVARAAAEQRPMQATFAMRAPNRHPRALVSELAVIVRNRVRLEGMRRLGQPCHMTGSGMAFPWPVLRDAPSMAGHIVEDLAMGIAVALQGHPPAYCSEAEVRSVLPDRDQAALGQRRRWEHGQLDTLLSRAPRLLALGVRRGEPGLVALGLDLFVPPTALLTMLLGLGTVAAAGLALLGPMRPLAVLGSALAALALSIVLAWARYGRQRIPLAALATVPRYLLWKLPVYAAFAVGLRQRSWDRTARPRDVATRLDRAGSSG